MPYHIGDRACQVVGDKTSDRRRRSCLRRRSDHAQDIRRGTCRHVDKPCGALRHRREQRGGDKRRTVPGLSGQNGGSLRVADGTGSRQQHATFQPAPPLFRLRIRFHNRGVRSAGRPLRAGVLSVDLLPQYSDIPQVRYRFPRALSARVEPHHNVAGAPSHARVGGRHAGYRSDPAAHKPRRVVVAFHLHVARYYTRRQSPSERHRVRTYDSRETQAQHRGVATCDARRVRRREERQKEQEEGGGRRARHHEEDSLSGGGVVQPRG